MKAKSWKKILVISAIVFLALLLFCSIGSRIYYEIQFKRQNVITPVKGKILFRSIHREEPYYLFLLEDAKIHPVIDNTNNLSDYDELSAKGLTRIVIRNAEGKITKEVVIPKEYNPFDFDISPDSQTIVFTSVMGKKNNPWNLYAIDINGKNLKKITDFKWSEWSVGKPKFSPDGKKIAFEGPKNQDDSSSPASIYILNKDGTHLKELFGDKFIGGVEPAWSPDMKSIAFVSTIDTFDITEGIYRNLFTVDLDTLEVRQLTKFNEKNFGHVYSPCSSPDGKQICFALKTRGKRAGSEIFAINIDGTNLIRLTPAKKARRYPYFATDKDPDWGK